MLVKLLISSLLIYIYLADIGIGIGFTPNTKPIIASVTIIIFLITYVGKIKSLKKPVLPFLVVAVFIGYVFLWGGVGNINLLITPFYGWVLIQNKGYTLKLISYIFAIQFVLVCYEYISGTFIYTQLTSGVITLHEYDNYDASKLFYTTGFRPKGLFPGTLIASSFVIYYSIINRNNMVAVSMSFVMAIILNSRLAIIVTLITTIVFFQINYGVKIKSKVVKQIVNGVIISPFAIVGVYIYSNLASAVKMRNILALFDMSAGSNLGRLFRYETAINYIVNMDVFNLLFGNKVYHLYDQYGRTIPPESEILGMILEIGLIGMIVYLSILVRKYKRIEFIYDYKRMVISSNYGIIVILISMIIYRHVTGNQRGALFWFYLLSL